jgi:hypothetical protein
MNNLGNAFAREGLISETAFDVVEHLYVKRICLVQQVFQLEGRRAEMAAEMWCEDPPAIYIERPVPICPR